jgi:hypothetical protein
VYFFFPETSGLHLEEVDAIFTDSNNIFETVTIARQRRLLVDRGGIYKGKEQKQEVAEIEKRMPTP